MDTERARHKALEDRLRVAIDASPCSADGQWLADVLRTWNADPDTIEAQDLQDTENIVWHLKALFAPDVRLLAERNAGIVARVDILDLLHAGLYGRKIGSDWFKDYQAAVAAGEVSSNYSEYSDRRQQAVRDAGGDWPYSYIEGIDRGADESVLSYIKSRLEHATQALVVEREAEGIDLGIVFVHGIGTQGRGETLQYFGDSILEWMKGWLRCIRLERDRCQRHESWDPEPAAFAVRDANVRGGGDDPAYATLTIPLLRERWLMAEAWWAEELHVPSRSAQVAWLLLVTPIAVITFFSRKWAWRRARTALESEKPTWGRALMAFNSTVVFLLTSFFGTVFSLLMQLLIALIGIVAAFPVKGARSLLSLMQATVGDSLSFTESPIARSAIVSKVRKAIDFVSQRSKRVVVVAHSQGAAVAHRALRVSPPENVALLATVGAGIDKLEMLHAGGRSRFLFEALAISMCGAPLYALYATTIALQPSTLDLYLIGFFLLTYLGAWLLPRRRSEQSAALSLRPIRWVDFYAESDPVPNGPIVLGESEVVESHMVHNLSSILRDHTSYWQNRDEFVASLLRALSETGLTHLVAKDLEQSIIDSMVARRRQRLFWLRLAKASYAMAAFVTIVLSWSSLGTLGQYEIVPLFPPLQGWLDGWGEIYPATLASTLGIPSGHEVMAVSTELAHRIIGAVGIMATLAIWYLPAQWLWRWWNFSAMRRFSAESSWLHREREIGPASGAAWLLFLSLMACIQLVPTIVVLWLTLPAWAITIVSVTATLAAWGGSMILADGLRLGYDIFPMTDKDHPPTLGYMLPMLALIAGMLATAAALTYHQSLFGAYSFVGAGLRQVLDVTKQHPIIIAPFIVYMMAAALAVRAAIESVSNK